MNENTRQVTRTIPALQAKSKQMRQRIQVARNNPRLACSMRVSMKGSIVATGYCISIGIKNTVKKMHTHTHTHTHMKKALDGARSTAVPAMPTMPELSLSSALNMEPPSVADDVIAAPALASAAAGGVAPHVPAAALTAHAAPIMAPAVLSLSALPKHLNMPTGRPAVEIATPDLDTSLDLTMYNITSVALMDATTAPSPAAAADEGEEAEGVVDESFAEPREDAELPQVDVQEEGGAEEQDAAGAAGTAEQPAALVVDELSVSEIFAPVTDEEYGKMPHYFSLTLSLENLNDAIAAIEDCITETDAPISEVVFTQTQLKEDLGLGAAAKPVLLILIKLKRLESKAKSEDGETFYCFKTTR